MNSNKIILGITPARGGSKGIPRKNIKVLGKIPLVAHTIIKAKKSKYLTHYLVNSEDFEIREVAESYGAETMSRPDAYSHDQILQEVDLLLRWTVEKFEKKNDLSVDIVVLLYPTAPLRDVNSIDRAIHFVLSEEYDSAVGVYYDSRYLWHKTEKNTIFPSNYDPNNRMPRQKEDWNQWAENKAVYAMTRNVLFDKGRIGSKCAAVEMDRLRSIDIDEPADFEIAQALLPMFKDDY
jgi:CMP-N,N'-diacetyllegionaminic acid synthase